jgi:hypothetical protein
MSASHPKATESLRSSEMTLSADFVAEIGDQYSETADAIF